MRILTVRQPWAWAIIHGGKTIENRTQNPAGSYRGPIAIHAGLAQFDEDRDAHLEVQRAIFEKMFGFIPTDGDLWDVADTVEADDPRFLYGAIIGVVDLVNTHQAQGEYKPLPDAPWIQESTGRHCCSPWGELDTVHLMLHNPRPPHHPDPVPRSPRPPHPPRRHHPPDQHGARRIDRRSIMTTQTYTGTLVVVTCATCHQAFGIDDSLHSRRCADHESFWCPSGHPNVYTAKSEAEKLAEQLATEKRRRGWAEARATATRDQLHATERSLRGHKAAKTRIKNRIAAGVCPCCNRSFQNVASHMAGQHPDFAHTETEGAS